MADLVAAIDQGTTSTRCILFDRAGTSVSSHQIEHDQIMPRAGWVEHDPLQIWQRTETVVQQSMAAGGVTASDIAAVGITNQRETTVVWNRRTGEPYHNAVVWQDTRTAQLVGDLDRAGTGDLIRQRAGIPPATYFAGGKLAWLLQNVEGLRAAAEAGDALFGTIDTWLLWNLTGGTDGGHHLTDVTNASRTMLMNLAELRWDDQLLELFDIPRAMLPVIVPSSHAEKFGTTRTAFGGEVVIGGVLGDQHAAMVGQVCLDEGDAKNTYGTGNFLLMNTGTEIVHSTHGLLSTVCYQFGDEPARYALEGSIA
ncbi:MAG TPA: FGGY family carbohydrate kinase, partial [Microlunatus sp.]|nr:FGGY family carbohydrate kinase [Microlunatus sp.]